MLTLLAVLGALEVAAPLGPKVERGLQAVLTRQCEQVAGWSWEAGETAPAHNVGGVVANALLDTYARYPSPATWVTLVQYGAQLRRDYASPKRRPYKADVEFLARLGTLGLDPEALPFARTLFERVRALSPRGADEYHRIATGRGAAKQLVGYDVALSIRAALAVGQAEYANDMAQAALLDGGLDLLGDNDSWSVTSLGAMVNALTLLGDTYDDWVEIGRQKLVAAQDANGSWASNDTQTTAYALLGLAHPRDAAEEVTTERGRAWLLSRQLKDGGWASYHDGLRDPAFGPVVSLVEAESLSALVASLYAEPQPRKVTSSSNQPG